MPCRRTPWAGHFVPGMHYVSVDSVDEIPSMIKRLQADQEWARTIARAGQAQMASLDVDEVLKRGVWITPCGSAWLGKALSVSYHYSIMSVLA